MSGAMRVEMHESLEPLSSEWEALADDLDAVPWLRPGWTACWWRAFGHGRLVVLAVRDGEELAGVLPITTFHGAVASPTNWHTPEFGVLGRTPAHRVALAGALFAQRPLRATVSFLDRDAGFAELQAAAREGGYRLLTRVRQRSPYIPLTTSFEDYLATLDLKHVKEIRRLRRRLEEEGDVRFETATDTRPFEDFLRVEAAGWKGAAGTAVASQPETDLFYREIAEWAARRGTFRLASLRLDGRPLACEFLLEEGGVLYDVKGGYDADFRRFAPGQLLTYELIADATARGVASFELLGGDERFKLEWSSHLRERVHLDAFAAGFAGTALYCAHAWGRPVAKRLLRR